MTNIIVQIENGIVIGPQDYIKVYREGTLVREYCRPREGVYVRFWTQDGRETQQECGGPGGYRGAASCWPASDVETAARWMAKRWRMKFVGRQA